MAASLLRSLLTRTCSKALQATSPYLQERALHSSSSRLKALNRAAKVELMYRAQAKVAESPFYEAKTHSLLWVDILKNTINFFCLDDRNNRVLKMNESVHAAIPVAGSESLLMVLLGKKICLVDRHSGTVLEVLQTVQDEKKDNSFSDAKCDSSGRLWCGTMGLETEPGVMSLKNQGLLFSFSSGMLKEHVVVSLSNGLDWNPANDTMYHIDSPSKNVYSFAYDKVKGALSNKQVLIDYSQDPELSVPDGLCVDAEGHVWVASFGLGYAEGQRVTCWDPKSKKRLMTLRIPGAKRITSCCFGGPHYEWMFVTSATNGASSQEIAEYPNSGALFVVKDLGVCGKPAHTFKLH